MIDYRLNTFLNLCDTLNYTITAKNLHMTQPAVTQHIQFLEEHYKVELFIYENRKLHLTEAGKKLYDYAISLKIDSEKIEKSLMKIDFGISELKFGATLTIGEYIMPEILSVLKKENPKLNISMRVANTENLIKLLHQGVIDFAIIEGHFNKLEYEYFLFSNEKFIGVRKKSEKLNSYKLKELYTENLIVRERGSGTREILEQILYEQNLNMENFNQIMQIGNINAIKKMVENDLGITFLYEKAVEKKILDNKLEEINIENFNMTREFNFIFLKDSYFYEEYKKWYDSFIEIFNKNLKKL